jgi:hypothetical protein
MRRFRLPEIIIGMLLASSFWAIVFVFQPSPQNQNVKASQTETHQGTKEHEQAESIGQRFSKIWDRTWEDPVAFYTFILSLFTGLLAFVSGIQIYFLIRADQTARIPAEAARLTAEAAVNAKLPVISFDLPDLAKMDGPLPEGTLFVGEDLDGPPTEYVGITTISVRNTGQTPAFPIEMKLGCARRSMATKVSG